MSAVKLGVALANREAIQRLDRRRDYENMAQDDLETLARYKLNKIRHFGKNFGAYAPIEKIRDLFYSSPAPCLRILDTITETIDNTSGQIGLYVTKRAIEANKDNNWSKHNN